MSRRRGGSPRTMQDIHEYMNRDARVTDDLVNRPIPGQDDFNRSLESRLRDLRRAAEDSEVAARDAEIRREPHLNHIENRIYEAVHNEWDAVRRISSTDARIRSGVRDCLIGRTPPFYPTGDELHLIGVIADRVRERVTSDQNTPRQGYATPEFRNRARNWISRFNEAARTPDASSIPPPSALSEIRQLTVDFETTSGVHSMKAYIRPPGYWKRKDGKFIAIHDMPDEYIKSCMRMIKKNHGHSRPVRDVYRHSDIDNNIKVCKGFYLSPVAYEVYQELATELDSRTPKETRRIRR